MPFLYEQFSVREAQEGDVLRILEWRNSESVRKWMSSSKKIKLDDHIQWFNSRGKNGTSIFIVSWGSHPIGVFILKLTASTTNEYALTMYVRDEFQNLGVGVVVEWFMLETAFNLRKAKKLTGLMFKQNQVVSLHKYFGFEIKEQEGDFVQVSLTKEKYRQLAEENKTHIFKKNIL